MNQDERWGKFLRIYHGRPLLSFKPEHVRSLDVEKKSLVNGCYAGHLQEDERKHLTTTSFITDFLVVTTSDTSVWQPKQSIKAHFSSLLSQESLLRFHAVTWKKIATRFRLGQHFHQRYGGIPAETWEWKVIFSVCCELPTVVTSLRFSGSSY